MSEKEFEKAARKLELAAGRWRTQVEAFIEESGQPLIPNKVDLDYVPGYVFHPDVRPLDEDQQAFARVLLGQPVEPAFPQDPDSHECDTCGGWGRVKTGSKVTGQQLVDCTRCNGHGYISTRGYESARPVLVPSNGDEPVSVLTEEESAGEDAWGTPRNHPDWGKSPQYRDPNWLAQLEAYKAGEPAPLA